MRVEKALEILKAQENLEGVDIPKMIENAIRVLVYLRNQYQREYRIAADTHEIQMFWDTAQVKGTHNTYSHLAASLAGAGLTVASGVVGLKGVETTSKGLAALGQGSSATGQIFENRSLGNRVIYQHNLETDRQRRQRDDEDARGEKEGVQSALRILDQVMQSASRAREQVLAR